MNEEKLLSVIVPVYKVEPYLHRCIDSIRNQTYKNLQIILVDDGSPDNCGKICDEYAEMDARIIVVHQKNRGLSGARNTGLQHAKGEYVAFVDSDDWIGSDMYRTLVGVMEAYNLDMARCGIIETNREGEEHILNWGGTRVPIIGEDVFGLFFKEFLVKSVCNAVYRRDIVEGVVSPEGCHSEDNYVSGRYLYRSQQIMIVSQAFYYYSYNPAGIMHGGNKRRLDICVCTKKLHDDLISEEHMTNPLFIKQLDRKLARELFHFVRDDDPRFRIAWIKAEQKRFIEKNLDFLRALRFDYYLRKKHIRVV